MGKYKRRKARYPEELLHCIKAADNDDLPDGAWWAILEESVEVYNADTGMDFNPNEAVYAYLKWMKRREKDE